MGTGGIRRTSAQLPSFDHSRTDLAENRRYENDEGQLGAGTPSQSIDGAVLISGEKAGRCGVCMYVCVCCGVCAVCVCCGV